jgi:hypothetical protein
MRKFIFLSISIIIATNLAAQKSFKKNTFYAEILGSGMVLSINYERQLKDKPGLGYYFGIGLGGLKPAVPFGAKYLIDLKNQKSYIEAGAGITLGERDLWIQREIGQTAKNSYKPGFIPSIGYRHHTSYGFMWRVNYTPVFSGFRNIPLFFGLSLGWRI